METVHGEHPLVTLLAKRMASHPEEFFDPPFRWQEALTSVGEWGSDTDKEVLLGVYNKLRMDRAYEETLDELLNGDTRRAEQEAKARAHAQHYAQSQSLLRNIASPQSQSYYDQQNLYGLQGYANSQLSASNQLGASSLQIGDATLTEKTLKNLLRMAQDEGDAIKKRLTRRK